LKNIRLRVNKLKRTIVLISILILASAIQLGPAAAGEKTGPYECIDCHEEIYSNALANPYQHGMVMDKCGLCHIARPGKGETEEGKKTSIDFSAYQREGILYVGDLQDDQKYEMEITATDNAERSSKPYHISIVPGKAEVHEEGLSSIAALTGAAVEEIKMGVFVEATITWETDVPATSEVEYKRFNMQPHRFKLNNQFTKEHKVTLSALKHEQYYFYRVISRDIEGNMLQSEEEMFDTSEEIAADKGPASKDPAGPVINEVKAFRIKDRKGVYLKVQTSKPAKLIVSFDAMHEVREKKVSDETHSPLLAPARYAAIEACKNCHKQNASHPVGVRGKNDKIRTPDDLPTIDNGVVTCATCHLPHGGKKIYFARMDFNMNICRECHVGNYY
jgi:predicted CXXCH cytochrome family protein